jgi:competence protein ComEC
MDRIKNAFSSFWEKHPALFLSLCLFLGTVAHFKFHWLLVLVFAALCASAKKKKTWIIALLCFIGAWAIAFERCPKITLPQEKVAGKGIFHIDQVKMHSSPFNRSVLYKGTLKKFETGTAVIENNLPCYVHLPLFGKHPPATTDYEISGTLCQKADHFFVLKPEKKKAWTPVPSRFNLSHWRFSAQQKISKYLKQEIPDNRVRSFMNALATGDIDERILSMEFGKVGLQHILAISGFHFALAAWLINCILRVFFSYKISAVLLLIALTFYYLFLGNAPSIQRAYVAIALVAIGQLFSLRTSGLNVLGAGLIIELLWHPIVVTQLSFQLTFLCTLAILLFYPCMHRWISLVLPERSYKEMGEMNFLDKHGYLFLAFFRKACALNFAVHFFSVPVLLFLFHRFPLLSIAYNLFFPACISLSLLLLFSALLFAPWLPFISHAIHALNNSWTSMLMTMTSHPPAFLDFSLRTKAISLPIVVCFLTISFFIGVFFYEQQQRDSSLVF